MKSTVNVSTLLASVGIFGALLSRKGPAGSLLGIGLGTVAGNYTSKAVQNQIDKIFEDKK